MFGLKPYSSTSLRRSSSAALFALRLRQKKIAARMIRATETTGTTTATAILPPSDSPPELGAAVAPDREAESVEVPVALDELVAEVADSVWVWVTTTTVDWPLLLEVVVITLSVVEEELVVVVGGDDEEDGVLDDSVVVEWVVVEGSLEVVGLAVGLGVSLDEDEDEVVVVAASDEEVEGSAAVADADVEAVSAPEPAPESVAWAFVAVASLLAPALLLMLDDILAVIGRGRHDKDRSKKPSGGLRGEYPRQGHPVRRDEKSGSGRLTPRDAVGSGGEERRGELRMIKGSRIEDR